MLVAEVDTLLRKLVDLGRHEDAHRVRGLWMRSPDFHQYRQARRAFKENGGNLAAAAREVGLSPRTFRRRLYGTP